MNWDDLRVFLAVARTESLSGAGKALRIDPATVGRRILRLEEQLGISLFAKSPQGYELTRDGARLLAHAESAEQAIKLGSAALTESGDSLSGLIRVGAPDGCANFVLPRVVAKIIRDHPGLEIQIISQPRIFNLNRREVDFVVSVSRPQSGRLLVQKAADYHLSLAASGSYLDGHPEVVDLKDLGSHRIVGYVADLIFDKELDYLQEIGIEAADFASNSVSVQLQMLRAGLGIGVVHDFCLPYAQEVRRVLPEKFRLERSFYVVRHADDRKVDRLSRFADLLAAGVRDVVSELERDA